MLLDGLQEPDGDVEAIVGFVAELSCVFHGSEWTSGLCLLVKGTSWVPPVHPQSHHTPLIPTTNPHRWNWVTAREREREREIVRDAEHERSAVLLSNESPELPPRLLDGLLVLSAHGWVLLRHFSTILQTKPPNQKPKKYIQRSSIQKCRSIKETQTRTNRTQNSLILDRWRSVTNLGKQRSRFEKWENSNPREREGEREWHESNTGLGEWGYKGEAKRPVEKKVLVVFFKAVGLRWSCG